MKLGNYRLYVFNLNKIRACNCLSDTFAFGKVTKEGDGLLHLLSTLALECSMLYI